MIFSASHIHSVLLGQAAGDVNVSVVFAVIVGTFAMLFIFFVFIARVQKCGPNEVLVVSGGFGPDPFFRYLSKIEVRGFRIVKSGATFIFPMIQKIDRLSLELMPISFRFRQVNTLKGTPVWIEGVAQVKIKGDDDSLEIAAEQHLSKSTDDLKKISFSVIEGQIRTILAGIPTEEILAQRAVIGEKIRESANTDFDRMGMTVVVLSLTEILSGEKTTESDDQEVKFRNISF